MAARQGLVLKLGFDARGAFDEMCKSFEQTIKQLQKQANNSDIGGKLGDKFKDLEKILSEVKKQTDEMYSDFQQGGKVDTKGFQAFRKKVSEDFKSLKQQILEISNTLSAIPGNETAKSISEEFGKVKQEFQEIKTLVESTNAAFTKLAQLSSKYGQQMTTQSDSLGKNIRKIKELYKQLQTAEASRPKNAGTKAYASNYRRSIMQDPTYPEDETAKIFKGADVQTRFWDTYRTHQAQLTGLVNDRRTISEKITQLQSKNMKNTEEWYSQVMQRVALTRKIVDLYNEMAGLEDVNRIIYGEGEETDIMRRLNEKPQGSKTSYIERMKSQFYREKSAVARYLQDMQPTVVETSSFQFKDGKVKIPVDIDLMHSADFLTKQVTAAIQQMTDVAANMPVQIPIELKGVTVRGKAQTMNLLKAWGYDFEEAKDAVSSEVKTMGDAIADPKINTPSIDLGQAYAKAYLDSFHFATNALKIQIAQLQKEFVTDGKVVEIPIKIGFETAIGELRSAIEDALSNSGVSAANSWRSAMISSIGTVANAFQSAMGKGLQIDNTLFKNQLNSIKNQLTMALGKVPEDAIGQRSSISRSVYSTFAREYSKAERDASQHILKDDQLNISESQILPRNGFIHYFEQTFQYLQRLKAAGGDVQATLKRMFSNNNISQKDASAIRSLFESFEARNPVPENIAERINNITNALTQLKGILQGISESVGFISDVFPEDGIFGLNTKTLDSTIIKMQQAITIFRQATGILTGKQVRDKFSPEQIEAQWQNVIQAYKKISKDDLLQYFYDGQSERSQKLFKGLQDAYFKYVKSGGLKSIQELYGQVGIPQDDEAISAMDHVIDQISLKSEGIKSILQDSLQNAGLESANVWTQAMLEGIEKVRAALQSMFQFQSNNKIYQFLKGWSEADSIMRRERKDSSSHDLPTSQLYYKKGRKYILLDPSEQPGNGQLQRAAYFNSKTGAVSNTYTVDQRGSTRGHSWLTYNGINVKDYDTNIHTHPIGQGQDSGLRSIGHNLGFSAGDLKSFMYDYTYDNIKKFAVESNGMLSHLDFSDLSSSVVESIVNKYTSAIDDGKASLGWVKAKNFDEGIFDYEVLSEYYHQIMRNAIKDSLVEQAKAKGQILDPNTIDISKYYKQMSIQQFNKPITQDGSIQLNALADAIHTVSTAMSEMSAKGGFNFKFDMSSLENLESHLQSIVTTLQALKQNFDLAFGNLNGLKPWGPDIQDFLKDFEKLEGAVSKNAASFDNQFDIAQYFGNTFRSLQKYQAITGGDISDYFKDWAIQSNKISAGTFLDAYQVFTSQNPIPKNIPKTIKSAISDINGLLGNGIQSKDGNVLGVSSDQITQITEKFQELANVLKQFNSTDFSGLSSSIDRLVEATGKLSSQEMAIKPDSFKDITNQLEGMLHIMEQVTGVFSQRTIDEQWGNIEAKFKALTDASPKLNLKTQKQELEDFVAEYQKYLNMGGTKDYTQLTSNKTVLGKLQKMLPTTAQQKQIPETKINITSTAKQVESELQTLVENLKAIVEPEYQIKLTLPATQGFANDVRTLIDSVSDAGQLKVLSETLSEMATTLERINGYKNTGTIFKGLRFSDDNLRVLEQMPEKIGAIRDSLYRFPTNGTKFFSGIQNVVKNAKALENLITALKAKQKDLDAVTGAATGTGTVKPKTTSQISGQIYTALIDNYSNILKKTKSIKRNTPDEQMDEITSYIKERYEAIDQLQAKLDSNKALFNIGKDNKISILKQEIELQEELRNIRLQAAQQAQDQRQLEAEQRKLEVIQALKRDTEGWANAIDALKKAGVYDQLGDITKIDRRIRRDEKTDEYYISYRATDAQGNNRTVGHNGDLLIDNKVAANPGEIYKEVTQHLKNILNLRTQIASMDKTEQPRAYKNATQQLKKEEQALQAIKDQASELQNLVPGITAKISQMQAEWGDKTNLKVKGVLDSAKDTLTARFKGIEQQYGDVLKASPDLQQQFEGLRISSGRAKGQTRINEITAQITALQERLKALSEIDLTHAGWDEMIKSFGNLSGVEDWAKALDNVNKKIAEYEQLVAKIRSGGNLSIEEQARKGQLQTDINADLKRIKTKTSPEQMVNLDQRKEVLDRAKQIMREMSELNIEKAVVGQDENRIPILTSRLEELDQRLNQVKQDAAALEVTVPGVVQEVQNMQAKYDDITKKGIQDSVSSIQQKLTADLEKVKAGFGDLANQPELKGRFEAIAEEIKQVTSNDKIPKVAQDIKELSAALKELDAGNIKAAGWNSILDNLDPTGKVNKFTEDIDAVKQKIREYQDLINKKATNTTLTDEEKFRVKDLEKQVTRQIAALQKNSGGKYNITNKYGTQKTFQNTDEIENYYRSLSQVDAASMKITTSNNRVSASFTKLNGDVVNSTMAFDAEMGVWREVQSTTMETANIFDRIGMSMKKSASYFRSYFSGYMVAQKMIAAVRGAINTIKDLDAQFTEMQKVSQDSLSSLREYADGAYDMAQKLGSTTSDILNSTADFLRIGQSIDKAGQSAQTAAILKNVSQYESISDATDSLIAMEQAYRDVDPMSIVDKLNLVGDRFAISTDELADGMKNAGSTLSLLGNSIDDTAALLTSANTVIQDISKVSSGMRTIALRVVGTEEGKAKLEEDGEDTGDYVIETKAKKRAKIKKYTATASNKQGVDILDANGNYKTTYEYMRQIANVYKEIQEQDKKFGTNRAVALIEELAGKTRSNIASAILSNPELLEQVKDVSLDSAGSALREQQIQLESIEGRMATFKAHAEEFWTSFIDTDVVKSVVSFGSDVLDVITDLIKSVPSLTTAFSALMAVFSTKGNWGLLNFDRNKGFSSPLLQAFKPYELTQGTTKALDALRGMSTEEFNILKANQNGNINNFLAPLGDADNQLKTFIANANSGAQAAENFSNTVGNSRPIVTGFQGVMSGLNNVFGKFASGMVNFGIAMAVSMAVKGLVDLVDYLVVTEEEIKKAGDVAKDTIDSVRKNIKDQNDLVKDLEESDFDSLVKGVDTKTNENISLTDEQYEEYLSTCNKIADIFPQMVASYDAQGNAILNLGSMAESATSQLQSLLDTNKAIAAEKIGDNLQDEYMAIKAQAEGNTGEGGIIKKIKEQQELIDQARKTIDKANASTVGLMSGKAQGGKQLVTYLSNMLDPNNIDADGVLDLSGYSETVYTTVLGALNKEGVIDTWKKQDKWNDPFQKIGVDLSKMTDEKIQNVLDSILKPTGEEVDPEELQKAYASQAEHSQKKSLYEKELTGVYARMLPDIQSSIENNPIFKELDQSVQSRIVQSIGNIDLSALPEEVKKGQIDIYDYIKQSYLQPVALAFMDFDSDSKKIKQAKQTAKSAITELFSIDPQETTGEEYQALIDKQLPIIRDYFETIYSDYGQASVKYAEFLQSVGLKGKTSVFDSILDAFNLEGQDRDDAYTQIKDLHVSQLKALQEMVTDPKYGGSLLDAIKKVTEEVKVESVSFSEILGSGDDEDSIISQAQALRTASDAIDKYKQSINGGEFTKSDLSKLVQEYPELAKNTELMNSVMDSFDASGFLKETGRLNDALTNIRLDKIEAFRKKFAEQYQLIEDESEKQVARNYFDSVISSMIPKDVSESLALKYLNQVAQNIGIASFSGPTDYVSEKYNVLKEALGQEFGSEAIIKILADPALAEMEIQDLIQYIEDTKAQIKLSVNEQAVKNTVSLIKDLGTKNSSVKDFETNLHGGTATLQDLLNILSDYPQVVGSAEDSISNLVNTMDFSSRLDDIQGIQQILSKIKLDNLYGTISSILGNNELDQQQKTLMKQMAFANADLSGITSAEAAKIVDEFADGDKYLIKMAGSTNALNREAAALAAGMGIQFDRAFQIVENRAEQTAVTAVQSFQSASNEIASFSEKAMSGQATSEDVFGLLETFPELFDKTDVLGEAFSQLSLSGAITDASTLQTILTEISQIRLKDMLQTNGITDYKVIQGLANTLDFSSKSVDSSMQNAYNTLSKSFTGLENIDLNTAQGRNIMGNIQFTINAVGGIDHLLPAQIQQIIDNAWANGTRQGVEKGLAQVKNLSDSMSSLSSASESIMSGQFGIDDVASLEENFADLNITGEQLNAIYSSLNMEGFVEDAESANALVNQLKIDKLKTFFRENESLTRQSKQAILNSTRLTGIGQAEGEKAKNALLKRKKLGDAQKAEIQRMYDAGHYDALVRLRAIPQLDMDNFWSSVQADLDAEVKDNESELQTNLEVITNISSKNKSIQDFADQVSSGEATVEGLVSLIQEVPEIAVNSGDALAAMMESANFDGTITSIDGLQNAANSFTLDNLKKEFDKIEDLPVSNSLKNALKGFFVDQANLGGTSFMQALSKIQTIDDPELRKQVEQSFRKGEFTAEAIMKVFLKGDIDDSDVMNKLEAEQGKINRRNLQADVNARVNFNSEMASIQGVLDEIQSNEVSVDSALSLAQTMPEIVEEAERLGCVFTDMNMDGILDDAKTMKKVLNNVQTNKLLKLVQNDQVSRAGKLTAIANTALGNITLGEAQKILGQNAKLVEDALINPISREAAVKAKLSLDAQGISEDAANYAQLFQNEMDGYSIDVSFRVSLENSEKVLSEIGSIGEQITSAAAGESVSVENYNLPELEDYKNTLEYTSNSIQYNYQEVRKLNKAKAEEVRAINAATKAEKQTQYRENAELIEALNQQLQNNAFAQGESAESVTAHINKLMSDNSILQDNINTLTLMNAAIDESISKYQEWKNAQSAPESGDMFDDTKQMWQEINDVFDPQSDTYQKYGTQKYKTALDFLMPEGLDKTPEAVQEWKDNVMKKFFTFDDNGTPKELNLSNFFNQLVDQGFAQIDENGDYQLLGEHTMQEIGDGIGMGAGFVEAAFGQANEYIQDEADKFKFTDPDNPLINIGDTSQLDQAATKLETIRKELDEMSKGGNVDLNNRPIIDSQELNNAGWSAGEGKATVFSGTYSNEDGTVAVNFTPIITDQNGNYKGVMSPDELQTYAEGVISGVRQDDLNLQMGAEFTGDDAIQQAKEAAQKIHQLHEAEASMGTGYETNLSQISPQKAPQIQDIDTLKPKVELETDLADEKYNTWKDGIEKDTIKIKTQIDTSGASENGGNDKVQGMAPKISNQNAEQNSGLAIEVDTTQIDKAKEELEDLKATTVPDKSFKVSAPGLSISLSQMRQLSRIELHDQSVSVNVSGNYSTAVSQIISLKDAINQLRDKTVNITVNKSGSGSVGKHDVMGTAHTLGSAYASGTARSQGRDFTVGKNETALVNEIGQESRIHNGKWELLLGGPHLQKLDRDDIVFNAQQTQDLIKSGKTARSGKPVATSHFDGTLGKYSAEDAFDELDQETLPAYAHGTAKDLVGERGMEMYVDPKEGKWHTIGETGPQMVDLPKNAVVFNHEQTADLLNKGYTNTRATLAHTDGTFGDIDLSDEDFIYNPLDESEDGNAFLTGNSYYGAQNYVPSGKLSGNIAQKQQKKGNNSNDTKAKKDNTNATKKNTKATKDNTKKKEKEGQVFDWVASRLSYLADQTAKFADAITDFISYGDKITNLIGSIDSNGNIKSGKDSTNKSVGGQLQALINEIAGNRQGAARYRAQVNSIHKPYENPKNKKQRAANKKFEETKSMIKAGYKIDIETIKDDKLAKAIQDVQQYNDAANQAQNNIANLNRSLVELYDTWAKAPAEEAEKQIERIKKGLEGLEVAESRIETASKGGSTQALLDRLTGNKGASSASYTNLSETGFKEYAKANAQKTAYYIKAFQQRNLQLDRVAKNADDYQKLQNQLLRSTLVGGTGGVMTATRVSSENSTVSGNSISRKDIKKAGRQVAKTYAKQLTKKQQKALKKGKTISTKKIKNKDAKKAVKQQNQYVKAYKAQTNAKKEGRKIAKKYSKPLSKKQEKALRAGNEVKLTKKQKKNKKLRKAVNKYNKKATKAKKLTSKTITTKTAQQGVKNKDLAQEIVGNASSSLQSFLDALNSAQTDQFVSAAELAAQKVQQIKDNFDYINEAYEKQISYQESLNKLNEQYIDDAETFGDEIKASDRTLQQKNLATNKAYKEREVNALQKELDAGVKTGTIKEGSREWIQMQQKINEAKAEAHQFGVEIKQLEIKKLEDISDHFEKLIGYMESIRDLNNIWNDRDEIVGNYKQASYYAEQIAQEEAIRNKKREEATKAQLEFWKMSGKAQSGDRIGPAFVKGSDSYIAKQTEINKLWKEVYDSENAIAKLQAERIQFEIDEMTRVLEQQDTFINNLNTMGGLINDAAKWNYDTGDLTEQGQLTMVIDKESYNNALEGIQTVAQQKEKLLERLRNDASYGQQAYDEDIKDLTSRQMSYLSDAKSAMESFTKTVETTAQKQLEALNKVINKYKEGLQKKDEYYKYDKQLKNANKEIALLEAQSRALEGMTDAQSKAAKARLDAQIAQKRESLDDTVRDHTVNLQTEGLSDLQEKMQENYDKWSQEFEANASKQIDVMQSTNMTLNRMSSTMNAMLSSFGTNMTQMGVTIGTVNSATTAAITGMSGAFTAFTSDRSAYELALESNAVAQANEQAAWKGPVSSEVINKMGQAWTGLTTQGQATQIENSMLDSTGDLINANLATLDETVASLPGDIAVGQGDNVDAVDNAAGSIIESLQTQAQALGIDLTGPDSSVVSSIKNAVSDIGTMIQFVIDAIGKSSAKVVNTIKTSNKTKKKTNAKKSKKSGSSKKSSNAKGKSNKNRTKKSGNYKKKRLGTMSINKDDIYLTQEDGGEIITTKDGVLIPLEAGDGVVPAQLTEKLFEMARNYPIAPTMQNVQIPNLTSSGTSQNVTVTYGSLLTVNGNVDKEILPSLKTILQESYEYTQKKLAQDALKGGMRRNR